MAALTECRHWLRRLMNLVASGALHLIASMRRHVASTQGSAVEVAGIADLGSLHASQFCGLADVLGVDRLGVLRAWTVAGFAGFSAKVHLGLSQGKRVNDVVPIAGERLRDILMTQRTLGFTGVWRSRRSHSGRRLLLRRAERSHTDRDYDEQKRVSAHALDSLRSHPTFHDRCHSFRRAS